MHREREDDKRRAPAQVALSSPPICTVSRPPICTVSRPYLIHFATVAQVALVTDQGTVFGRALIAALSGAAVADDCPIVTAEMLFLALYKTVKHTLATAKTFPAEMQLTGGGLLPGQPDPTKKKKDKGKKKKKKAAKKKKKAAKKKPKKKKKAGEGEDGAEGEGEGEASGKESEEESVAEESVAEEDEEEAAAAAAVAAARSMSPMLVVPRVRYAEPYLPHRGHCLAPI